MKVSHFLCALTALRALIQSETLAVTNLRGQYESAVGNIREQNSAMKTELQRFHALTSETQDALIELARALKTAV